MKLIRVINLDLQVLTTQINCMTALVLSHAAVAISLVVCCSQVRLALVAGVFPSVMLVLYLKTVLVRLHGMIVMQLVHSSRQS